MASLVSVGTAAILQKYSALNHGIEQSRRDCHRITNQLEEIQIQLSDLSSERTDMSERTQQIQMETTLLEKELKEALANQRTMKQDRDDACRAYDEAMRKFLLVQSLRDNDRIRFMEDCRKYRDACKRIRLSAWAEVTSTGDKNPRSHSFRMLPPDIDECSYDSENETKDVSEAPRLIEYTQTVSQAESDGHSSISESVCIPQKSPDKESIRARTNMEEEKDAEVKVARQKESSAFNTFLEAKRDFDQAVAEEEEVLNKAEVRMTKLEQQKAQLTRIKNDVEMMEKELISLDQNSKEVRQISQNLIRDINRKKALHRDSTTLSSWHPYK